MASNGNGSFSVDEWLVEPALNRISFRDETHYLRPQVMDLLVYLARRNGEVVSTEELLTDLWVGRIVSQGTLYNCIAELRQALTNGHDSGAEIENIPKKGYRLVANVQGVVVEPVDAPAVQDSVAEDTGWLSRGRLIALLSVCVIVIAGAAAFTVLRPTPLTVTSATQLSTSQILFPPVPSTFPLVTDGSRIYFNDWVKGRLGLRQMLVAGGEAIRMESPFDDPELLINPQGVAPDGTDLMVTTFDPSVFKLPSLWMWPILDGPPRQIGSAGYAKLSPDGSRIAYSNERGELLLADGDMGSPQVLAKLRGRIFWMAFSPDEQHIRFSLMRGNGLPNSLWEIPVTGGEPTRLLPEWSARSHCCGSWTADGEHFIFQAIDNGRSQIWAWRERDGLFADNRREPHLLTRGPIDYRRATLAPGGDRLFAVGWQLRGEIVRYDAETDNFIGVPALETLSADWLAFKDDKMAYMSYPDATLWISDRNGGNKEQLTFPPLRGLNPVWSPDGRSIAFVGLEPGREKRIFRVSLDTRQVTEATAGDARQASPTWSPDGSKIAFNERGQEEIQLLDVQTGAVSGLAGTSGLYLPSWSHDDLIAAISREGLALYDVASGEKEIITDGIPIERLYWDSSGEHVFFYEPFWRADQRALYKVNVNSKSVEYVANVGEVRSTFGTDGIWIGPGPDDEPLLLRDLSIHHIYSLELARN